MSEIRVDSRDRVNCLLTASCGEPSHLHKQPQDDDDDVFYLHDNLSI